MEWRRYKNSNYEVSEYSDIRHIVNKIILKPQFDGKYLRVKINVPVRGKVRLRNMRCHIMGATCFVAKPKKKGYNIVNHKDLNKLNNHYTNFEWTTISGNTKHAYDNGRITTAFKKKDYDGSRVQATT